MPSATEAFVLLFVSILILDFFLADECGTRCTHSSGPPLARRWREKRHAKNQNTCPNHQSSSFAE